MKENERHLNDADETRDEGGDGDAEAVVRLMMRASLAVVSLLVADSDVSSTLMSLSSFGERSFVVVVVVSSVYESLECPRRAAPVWRGADCNEPLR